MSTFGQLALGLSLAAVGSAASVASLPQPETHAHPRLVSEFDALVPGQTASVAVTFDIDPHWHLYWPGRNDTGLPPTITWTLPQGFTAGEPTWPAPKRLLQPGDVLDHVYESGLTVLVPIAVPREATPGQTVRLHADLAWLACERVCVPESASVDLVLPLRATASSLLPTKDRPLLDAARAATPKPLPKSGGPVAVRFEPGRAVLTAKGAEHIAFFPAAHCVATPAITTQGEAKGDTLSITLDLSRPGSLTGIIELRRKGEKDPAFYTLDTPAPSGENTRE